MPPKNNNSSNNNCRYDHVTDALVILHWLYFPERVNFKLALVAYRVLHAVHSMVPPYLNQLVPVSNLPSCRRLRSSSTLQRLSRRTVCQLSAIDLFRLQLPSFGTLCHKTSTSTFYFNFSSSSKEISVSAIISWHHPLTALPWTS